tara:strand:+ start:1641 stop:2207 length:567 start_codon:yes stop_codon:yes gene_type:complete
MSSIFEFEIKIEGLTPPIWRRVQINAEDTFEDLHMLLQIVFGWQNSQLFEFFVDNLKVTMPDEEGVLEELEKNAFTTPLCSLLKKGQTFSYTYDLEESWGHEVVLVEELENEKLIFPNCLNGELSGPLEDSGGIEGYLHILEILQEPNNDDYDNIKEWVGDDFDPEEFDLHEANEIIIEYFSQKDREN